MTEVIVKTKKKKRNPKFIDFTIPVDGYIQKYLKVKTGGVIQANANNFIGATLLLFLKKPSRVNRRFHSDIRFPVKISAEYEKMYGFILTESGKNGFSSYVDKMFRTELLTYVKLQRSFYNRGITETINSFLDFYEITEDEIKLDSLIKYCSRYGATKKIQ